MKEIDTGIPEVNAILGNATTEQIEWVSARMWCKTDKEASAKVGVHHKTPYTKWENKADLDLAVDLLRRDAALGDLAGTFLALRQMGPKIVVAIDAALTDNNKNTALVAVREWRMMTIGNMLDVTSGGQPLKGYIGISPDDWDTE